MMTKTTNLHERNAVTPSMKFLLFINCVTAPFWDHDNPSHQVALILRNIAVRITGHPHFSPGHSQPVYDQNRNEVGHFVITE